MATVPLSGTNIRLISGVPFSNDYKHTRWFDTVSAQTSYFLNKPIVRQETEHNFQRVNGGTYMAIGVGVDALWGTNYIMFQNAQYNNKWFYAFVTNIEYVNRKLTHVHFQIDVFQTWKFSMNFKPSFVVREHTTEFVNGKAVINTVDEGLNYGTEYDTVSVTKFQPSYGFKWLVIASKQPIHNNHEQDASLGYSGIVGAPQPLSYYIIPFKDNGATATVKAGTQTVDCSPPSVILDEIRKNTTAVGNIVSMYVTDYTGVGFNFTEGGSGVKPHFDLIRDGTDVFGSVSIGDANLVWIKESGLFSARTELIGDKYAGFYTSEESKLYMYPYCVTVLDDFKGNRVEIKNEHIVGNDLVIRTKGSLGHSNKTSYAVRDYNFKGQSHEMEISDEYALINSKPNDIPIINDMLAAFIQGNRNTMGNQLDSMVWGGIMGSIGGAIGTIAGASTGSIAGTASGITSTVSGAGNSVLAIQGIEAKVEDIKNVPASISKMGGSIVYESGNNFNGLYIIKKQIKPEYKKKLSDFFKMFGYKINEVKIPNFHTRRSWNYVQTESCIITGNFNNEDLNDLKKVFDGGITFWHTDDVGNYALLNEVI